MGTDALPKISSLAAPTKADEAVLRSLTWEQYRALVAEHLERGQQDIREGRYTTFRNEEEIAAYFDKFYPPAEAAERAKRRQGRRVPGEALLRPATHADYDDVADVMFDAVRNGPSPYDEDQRKAWVPVPRSGREWTARLDGQQVVVADDNVQLVGFMTLEGRDHLDFAYVRPQARGAGLFRRLYEVVESLARASGAEVIHTEASLMARGPFEAVGFEVVREETVAIGNHAFRRFAMTKRVERF